MPRKSRSQVPAMNRYHINIFWSIEDECYASHHPRRITLDLP